MEQKNRLKQLGYTETMLGRRRYLPKIHSHESEAPPAKAWIARHHRESAVREGGNHPIQGTNADICKMAMLQVKDKLQSRGLKAVICLQVHDELVLDVPPDELDVVKPMVEETMSSVIKLIVPLVCDGRYGTNWAEAH
jgi:DNA polymerase-1